MRQTLIQLQLDSLFGISESAQGIPELGIGWMAVPWTVLSIYWFWRTSTNRAQADEDPQSDIKALATQFVIGLCGLVAVSLVSRGGDPGPTVPVYGYGFLVFLGCVAAGMLAVRHARRMQIPEQLVWDLAIWLFAAGVIGARGWYVLQYHEPLFAKTTSPLGQLKAAVDISSGGLVLYGGVGLSLLALLVFARRNRHICSPLKLVDLIVPSFFLALAFGRLGCLMNGCCWGDACELPWAIRFPHDSVPFNSLAARGFIDPDAPGTFGLHPSQIYSSFNGLVLCLVTSSIFRNSRQHGQTLAVALVVYPITRFLLEILRADEISQFGTGLTISQCFSLVLLCVGIAFSVWLRRQPDATTPATTPRKS
jgi:phosphatidylglycerol:prolipoprotein diacylglycerol transferase